MMLRTATVAALALTQSALARDRIGMRLTEESSFTSEFCLPPCACPSGETSSGLRGGYTLTLDRIDPQFRTYRVENVDWAARDRQGPVQISGRGEYRRGGVADDLHQMVLDLRINGVEWRFDSGLVPVRGDRFAVVNIDLSTPQRACTRLSIELRSRPACRADFNEDGFVDFFDAALFVECFEGGPCPLGQDADFNDDGFVDFFDLDEFLAAFERGCSA